MTIRCLQCHNIKVQDTIDPLCIQCRNLSTCCVCHTIIAEDTIICQECSDDQAIEDNKVFYAQLYTDPSYKTHECISCGKTIDMTYIQCSTCEAIADRLEYQPGRCTCDNDGSCNVCRAGII